MFIYLLCKFLFELDYSCFRLYSTPIFTFKTEKIVKCVWESFERNKVFIQSSAYLYSRNISTKSYMYEPNENYINNFAILDTIIIPVDNTIIFSSGYYCWFQRIVLLIPADTIIIDSSGYYYWFQRMLVLLIPANFGIVKSCGCANIIVSNGCCGSERY